MQKSLLKLLLAVAALVLSTAVHALGMGGINVTSALGQPLQADIELVAVGKAERDSLVARLAPSDSYKSAGLEYPHGNKFKFRIETRANGEPYLQVSSEQPVNDPFVSLLVELTWPSGKLLREYTFLLDPPGYVPEQPAQSNVQVVAPAVQAEPAKVVIEPVAAGVAPVEQVMPVETAAPWEQTTPAGTAAKEQPSLAGAMAAPEGQTTSVETMAVPEATSTEATAVPGELTTPAETVATPEEQTPPSETAAVPTAVVPEEQAAPEAVPAPVEQAALAVEAPSTVPEWVTVPRGSTMYELAEQYKLADMSVERMLVALYRANADEFDGKNMNRIRAGKILRLPNDEEQMSVTQLDAEKEIRVQAADWNAYRQKLASAAAVSSQSQVYQQIAVGKISSSVIDKAPVTKESAKEVLKLSKGEIPGDQAAAAGGKGMSEQDRKNAAQEEAIAKAKAMKEEQARAALLEKNLKDMQRLAQLKSEAAALAAKSSGAPALKADTASAVAVASAAKVESAIKPAVKLKAIEPEPTLIDQVLAEPLYMAGGAVVFLGLGGLGFVLVRRKKKSSYNEGGDSSVDAGAITGRIAAPVIPSPETGDFTRTVVSSAAPDVAAQTKSAQEQDSVDPISEADLFLSFGRDGQAEEILKDALKTMPGNHQIHLKLLGIYASRQDMGSFGDIARQLKDSGDEYAWQEAVEMGRKLEPDNPMYGGGGFRSMEDTGSATVQMAAFNVEQPPVADSMPAAQPSVLDFDFNLNAPQGAAAPSPEQNLLGDMETTTVLSSSGAVAEQVTTMDFDITSTHPMPGQAEGELATPDDMIFDVTGSHSMPAMQPEASKPAADSDVGMMFTLDFPVEKAVEKAAPEPVGGGLAGISLNFDEAPASSEPLSGGKGEHWQEVATKLDLAKAYQEMGDNDGAREIIEEVMREGDAGQREAAQTLLTQLG